MSFIFVYLFRKYIYFGNEIIESFLFFSKEIYQLAINSNNSTDKSVQIIFKPVFYENYWG